MDIVIYIQFFILLVASILVTYGYIEYTNNRLPIQKTQVVLLEPTIGELQKINDKKKEPVLDIFKDMFLGNQIIGQGGYDVNYGRIETQDFPSLKERLQE
jgi:hypothetical protein